ncbi:endonuclease domain-containing protein [Actinoplanes derwentensis]|uniref:endonuclease domain-containing protein n=1 Tax=Actinoplanes derwentensis TaxID=113562 RepID=UPI0018D305A2
MAYDEAHIEYHSEMVIVAPRRRARPASWPWSSPGSSEYRRSSRVSTPPTPQRLDGKPSAEPVRLVVDHCHQRQGIRGLLCVSCNSMLERARDRPEILRAGAAYLEC